MTESQQSHSDDPATNVSTPQTDTATEGPSAQAANRERRGPPPNPLYHPLFLPTLLTLFALWFGWDGFLTSDPEMLEHRTFNQVMFFLILPICAVVVPRGIKEFHDEQKAGSAGAARR